MPSRRAGFGDPRSLRRLNVTFCDWSCSRFTRMVSAICPATVASDTRVVPGVGGDRCGLRSVSESVFHSVLLLRPEWVGEPASLGVAVLDLPADSQTDTGLGLSSNNLSRDGRGDGGMFAYVRMSQRPAIGAGGSRRVALYTADAAPRAGAGTSAAGEGVRRSVADAAGDGQGQEQRPRVRAYGALARDAPGLPGGPPARRGPCLRQDHGRALVRRRDARSRSPVPSRQRSPPHAETPRRPLEDHFKTVSAASQNEDQQAA